MLRSTNHLPLSRTLLVAAGIAGLFSAGCVARVRHHAHVEYVEPVVVSQPVVYESPTLVYVSPGVYVVQNYDAAVYYSDGYYWSYRDGIWYQTAYWGEPWIVVQHVHVVPTVIVHQDHHAYVHYHGAVGAHTYKAPQRTYHTANASAHTAASPQPAPANDHAAGSVTAGQPQHHGRTDTVYTSAGGTMDAQANVSVRGTGAPQPAPQVYTGNDSRGATTVVPDNGSRGATTVVPATTPVQPSQHSGSSGRSHGSQVVVQPSAPAPAPAPVVAPAQRHTSAAPAQPVQVAPAKKPAKKPAATPTRKPTRGGS